MVFDLNYKVLSRKSFCANNYCLLPIRYEDRLHIMNWRNEQIEILRQKELLTVEKQDKYFKEVIAKLFEEEEPVQLIFSLLLDNKLIGYGGLVHIDWNKRTAEISFLDSNERARDLKLFTEDWTSFLRLIEVVAFEEINLNRINTYAYNLRPYLYPILETAGYAKDENKKQSLAENDKYSDIVIHYKLNGAGK